MKLVFIAPYHNLKKIAESVIAEHSLDIECYIGNLEQGLQIARKLEAESPCIFISRGGTASVIRDNLYSNVIEVKVSPFDLLQVLTPYIGDSQIRIGIVGFNSLLQPARSVCSILGLQVSYYRIKDEYEVFDKINQIRDDKIDVIVGDVISVRVARKYDLKYHLIESSEEAVKDAFDKALSIMSNIHLELEKLGKTRAVFDSVKDGIIAVDRDLKIEQFNLQAKEFLLGKYREGSLKGYSILDFIESSDLPEVLARKEQSNGKLFQVGKKTFVFNSAPVVIDGVAEGAVSVFQPVSELQKMESRVRSQLHKKGLTAKYHFDDIISTAPSMLSCLKHARQYGSTLSNILITGETGTGKELLAQSIHNDSPVKDGPFVAVNCSALSPTLLESELFGYVGGAFTGALKGGKTGLFELAHHGTIFLDEINSMDIKLQARLLRVLQEQEIMRLGDERIIPISVRVICATNSNLNEEVEKGMLRKDLFYRLSVLEIEIPNLENRKDDILPLFKHFIVSGNSPVPNITISRDFEKCLLEYSWPGNVRELENMAEKYMTLIQIESQSDVENILCNRLKREGLSSGHSSFSGSLKDIEAGIIEQIFQEEDRNISRTASRLQIDRNTLKRKLSLQT